MEGDGELMPTIVGGLEPGTVPYICHCGRDLGTHAATDGKLKVMECKCGRTMAFGDVKVPVKERRSSFCASTGG